MITASSELPEELLNPQRRPRTASMILKKAAYKRPLLSYLTRSFSANEGAMSPREIEEKNQLLRLQPMRSTDEVSLLGLHDNRNKRYVMPQQIVLYEHIYSDDCGTDAAKPCRLISNHSRKMITPPYIMYCDERYKSDKYSIFRTISKRADEQRRVSARSVPITVRQNTTASLIRKTFKSVGSNSFSALQTRHNRDSDHEVNYEEDPLSSSQMIYNRNNRLSASQEGSSDSPAVQLLTQPCSRQEEACYDTKAELKELLGTESVQLISNSFDEDVEINTSDKPQSLQIPDVCSDHGFVGTKIGSSVYSFIQPSLSIKQPIPECSQSDPCHSEMALSGISISRHLVANQYPVNKKTPSQEHVSQPTVHFKEEKPCQVASGFDTPRSQSNPVQSETIYGTILSFERKCLPESVNDSFNIRPVQPLASDSGVSYLRDNSIVASSSLIALDDIDADDTDGQSSDISNMFAHTADIPRLSCTTPVSPMFSPRSITSSRSLSQKQKPTRRVAMCISPPASMKPSPSVSKVLNLHGTQGPSKASENLADDLEDMPVQIIRSAGSLSPPEIKGSPRTINGVKQYRTRLRPNQLPRAPPIQPDQYSVRCELHPSPQTGLTTGLVVHSFEPIEPIHTPDYSPKSHVGGQGPVVVSADTQANQESAPATSGTGLQQTALNMGISRYSSRLREFILATIARGSRSRPCPSSKGVLSSSRGPDGRQPRLHSTRARFRSAVKVLQPLGPVLSKALPESAAENPCPVWQSLGPSSPRTLQLLYNTPMAVVPDISTQATKQLVQAHQTSAVRIFPNDCPNSPTLVPPDCPTPKQAPHKLGSVYAPLKLPTNEQEINRICEMIAGHGPKLTEEDIENMRQIFLNSDHDSSSSRYAQRPVPDKQTSYIMHLFADLRKESRLRREYGINRVKRGLNMELYKRIKRSDGDEIVHKIRGIHPDTDSSAPDNFEAPDLREVSVNSPSRYDGNIGQTIQLVKEFLYTPSSSTLEDPSPRTFLQSTVTNAPEPEAMPPPQNSAKPMVITPINSAERGIVGPRPSMTGNKIAKSWGARHDTSPADGLNAKPSTSAGVRRGKYLARRLTANLYNSELQPTNRSCRIRSAPLCIQTHDSVLIRIMKAELNKQVESNVEPAVPMSIRSIGPHSQEQAKRDNGMPHMSSRCGTVQEYHAECEVLLDDHENIVSLSTQATVQSKPPVYNIHSNTEKQVNDTIPVTPVHQHIEANQPLARQDAHTQDHVHSGIDLSKQSPSEPDAISKIPMQADQHPHTAIPQKHTRFDLCAASASTQHNGCIPYGNPENSAASLLPCQKQEGQSSRTPQSGHTRGMSSRKSGRRFYKTATIDREVGHIYNKYVQDTNNKFQTGTATKLDRDRLLSRPLTVSKERICRQIELYQDRMGQAGKIG